jgi:ABC-type branched-subunit amino acid transport system ATPase component/ABC-type branched-subunit amino acid transport system permease subunit
MTAVTLPLSRTARVQVPVLPFALLAAAVLPGLASQVGLLDEPNATTLTLACVYAIGGLSLNLLLGYAGQISLGQFAFIGVGGFTTGLVTGVEDARLPWLVGLVASAAAGGALAFLVGLPALRLKGLYLAVVTIAVGYAASDSLFRINAIGGGSAGKTVPPPYIGSHPLASSVSVFAIGLVLLVLTLQMDVNLVRSRLGRAFRVLKSDEAVAASFGVDVARYKLLAFTLSGAVAGVAGCLFGTSVGTVQGGSFEYKDSLALLVVVVLGGLGSRTGVVSAAFLTAVYPPVLIKLFGDGIRGWDQVVNGFVLVLTVAFQSRGFAGAIADAKEHRAMRAGGDAPLPPTRPHLPDLGRPKGLPEPRRTQPGTAVLDARDISVRFGGLQAVDGASLRVDRGTVVALMGPNGAGKTTMFNAISGALTPDTGTVHFLGEDVSRLAPHARAGRGMGRTFQLIGLAKDQSVYENLLIAQHLAAPYGVLSALTTVGSRGWEKQVRQRADQTLDGLGFGRFRDTPVGRLSHGQQRIVEIGCCLVTSPELVMLDEPSAGMSPAAAEDLAATLLDIRDQLGRTILLIEHNVPLVLGTADELYVMDAGQVIADGEPLEVVTRPEVVRAYLGEVVL